MEFLNFLHFGGGGGDGQKEGFGTRALTERGQGGLLGRGQKTTLEERLGLWGGERD